MSRTQEIQLHKMHVLLHRSWVEARNLALAQNCRQLLELADTFENVPTLLTNWKDENLDRVRELLTSYRSKYPESAYDYLSILNMDDGDFLTAYAEETSEPAGLAE